MASKRDEGRQFDLSKKVVVSLATLPNESPKTIHQKVDSEAAKQTMMSLVQRCNEWNSKKKESKHN